MAQDTGPCPTLRKLLWDLDHPTFVGRRILGYPPQSSVELLALIDDLAHPASDTVIGPRDIDLLCKFGAGADVWPDEALAPALQAHVYRRWDALAPHLAALVLTQPYRQDILAIAPRLQSDPTLVEQLPAAFAVGHKGWLGQLVSAMPILSRPTARTVLTTVQAAGNSYGDEDYVTRALAALGRGLGWTPWAQLLAVLISQTDYADLHYLPPQRDPTVSGSEIADDQREIAETIAPANEIRVLARLLIDLTAGAYGPLLERPAETRAAFVSRLVALAGDDADLRCAALEALLWLPSGAAARDLAQFAAVRLAREEDAPFLLELASHPVTTVGYAADAVRRAVTGERAPDALPLNRSETGLADALARLGFTTPLDLDAPRTWIGDRLVERQIETLIAKVETRFGVEYENYGGEGEERLGAKLFHELSIRFEDLDQVLAVAGRAAASPRQTSIRVRYRDVDKPEEGKAGVRGVKRFSADLCLIIDPILDGQSLGRRVTLVQAKRLYRDNKATDTKWDASYHLKPQQMDELIDQTEASVYMFHGPTNQGRGVPVIPTRLVRDLALVQVATGAELAHDTVGSASRSLADWFTYDLLALRTGDPYQELIDKAEGRPGALARRLLDVPTLEIDIAVGAPSGERGL